MLIPLKAKDSSVNLDLHEEFQKVVPVLKTAFRMFAAGCIVTSGKDGKHSAQSAHYAGMAIDLRNNMRMVPEIGKERFAFRLSGALVECCGPEWYVVLESDHIHLEYAPKGQKPNIKGFQPGKNFYVEAP